VCREGGLVARHCPPALFDACDLAAAYLLALFLMATYFTALSNTAAANAGVFEGNEDFYVARTSSL